MRSARRILITSFTAHFAILQEDEGTSTIVGEFGNEVSRDIVISLFPLSHDHCGHILNNNISRSDIFLTHGCSRSSSLIRCWQLCYPAKRTRRIFHVFISKSAPASTTTTVCLSSPHRRYEHTRDNPLKSSLSNLNFLELLSMNLMKRVLFSYTSAIRLCDT